MHKKKPISPELLVTKQKWIQQELASRELEPFVKMISYEPPPAKHHLLLLDKLQKIETGEIKRLMVFMPPGHAKSTYCSVLFPPYWMGRNERKNIIHASHTEALAERFGRKIRNIVDSPEYKDIYGFGLSPDSQAAGRWENAKGGEYYAVGVGGAVTGRRADLGIIDDPVKGREEADSDTYRNKNWEWFLSDFRTRLKPDSAMILIQTRWHEDDLAGRILPPNYSGESGRIKASDGEIWEILNLPALAVENDPMGREVGEPLWADWYSLEILEQERKAQGERNWSALYQQRPTPESGEIFKREWIRYYDEVPSNLKIFGASDYAVSEKGDYTVHGVFGVDHLDQIYILDWMRLRTDPLTWIEHFVNLVKKWKPIQWAEEKGQIIRSIGSLIEKRQREEKAFVYRKQFASSTDKVQRCHSFAGRMAQGMILFPKNLYWVSPLIAEMLKFPVSKYDDQVDVLSLCGRMLNDVSPADLPKEDAVPEFRMPTFNELRESNRPELVRYL